MANAKYKIDLVPGPRPEDADNQQGQVWDEWPVCYVVYRVPQADATTGMVTCTETSQSLPICPGIDDR
jgi:hypothetical protein